MKNFLTYCVIILLMSCDVWGMELSKNVVIKCSDSKTVEMEQEDFNQIPYFNLYEFPKEKDGSVKIDFPSFTINMIQEIIKRTNKKFFIYHKENEVEDYKRTDALSLIKTEIALAEKRKKELANKLLMLENRSLAIETVNIRIKTIDSEILVEQKKKGSSQEQTENEQLLLAKRGDLLLEYKRLVELKKRETEVAIVLEKGRINDEIKEKEEKIKELDEKIKNIVDQPKKESNIAEEIKDIPVIIPYDKAYSFTDYLNVAFFIHKYFKEPQTSLLIKSIVSNYLFKAHTDESVDKKGVLHDFKTIYKFYNSDVLQSFSSIHGKPFLSHKPILTQKISAEYNQILLTNTPSPKIILRDKYDVTTILYSDDKDWKQIKKCTLKVPANCEFGQIFTKEDGNALFFSATLKHDKKYPFTGFLYYDLNAINDKLFLEPMTAIPLKLEIAEGLTVRGGESTVLYGMDTMESFNNNYIFNNSVTYLVDATDAPLVGHNGDNYLFIKRARNTCVLTMNSVEISNDINYTTCTTRTFEEQFLKGHEWLDRNLVRLFFLSSGKTILCCSLHNGQSKLLEYAQRYVVLTVPVKEDIIIT